MTLDDMADDVALEVPGAPLASIRDMLLWAARELCTEADAWVSDEQPIIYGADSDHPVVVPPAGEPLRIVYLVLEGKKCTQGHAYQQHSPSDIEFHRKPSSSTVSGRIACRPSPGKAPPSEVLGRWSTAICNGARWRLLLLPQAWANPELAEYYHRRFMAGITDARQASRLGHGLGGNRVKARPFI